MSSPGCNGTPYETPALKRHYIYKVLCLVNNRSYIGQSVDPRRRFSQHRTKPPRRMTEDVLNHKPFLDCFSLEILGFRLSKVGANRAEKSAIKDHDSRGPHGYNRMYGNPASLRQYWYLKRRSLI
jgi:hypothetical protein